MQQSGERPTAPAGLGARGAQLWRQTTETYVLTPTELVLLEELARRVDESARLERVVRGLRAADLVVEGYMGQPVRHPLLDQLLRYDEVIGKLCKQLGLPDASALGLKGVQGGKGGKGGGRASRASG